MPSLWFYLVAFMLGMYFVLDGLDLGAGAAAMFIARTTDDRRLVLRSIGPIWDGNEVWLIAGGATLYFAFPALYASAFSGFYLPLMIVLWLLMLRGLAIEFRSHASDPLWIAFWDRTFALASAALALFFGVALGNVLRGVPLNPQGWFFLPLWTNLLPGAQPGIIDWYTLIVGLSALATLTMHGALWVALKTGGELELRARAFAARAWTAVLISTTAAVALTLWLQPIIRSRLAAHPWALALPIVPLALVRILGGHGARRTGTDQSAIARPQSATATRQSSSLQPQVVSHSAFPNPLSAMRRAFLASSAFILAMIFLAVFALYPHVLPATTGADRSLTIQGTAAATEGLRIGLAWWLPGMTLTAIYFVYLYRRFAGKVT